MGAQGDDGQLLVTSWVKLAAEPSRVGAPARKTEVDHNVKVTFIGGETRTLPFMSAMPEAPKMTKPGCRFLGWYLRGSNYKVYDEEGEPIVNLCQFVDELQLEAKWEAGPQLGVVNVTEDGTDLGPDAMGNPRVTLRDAVLAFSTNATLTGVDGLRRIAFELPEGQDTIRLKSEITIPDGAEPFEIFGLDNKTGRAVTISPDPNSGEHRLFTVRSSVSFRFLNFVGGRAKGHGGAIQMSRDWSAQSSLLLADCSFRNNSSTADDGVSPKIEGEGGAVWAVGVSCGIYNCSFEGNETGDWGGAVYAGTQSCLVNCTFSGNKAGQGGGGLFVGGASYAAGCTFVRNTAPQGRSVATWAMLTVLNSLFADGNEGVSFYKKNNWPGGHTLICSSVGASTASFFASGATPVTNDILGVVHVAYPPLPSNAQLRDAAEIYYDGLVENVAYQKPGETVKTALCGDAEKAQIRLGFDQLRAIRLCPTRGAIRLASGGGDATVNVEGRLAVPNMKDTWERNKTSMARVTVNYDDAKVNQVGVQLKTDNSGYFATSVVVDGSDGYSHNVTSLTFQASVLDPASVTVTNIAVTTVPYALVAASAELVDFPEAGVVRGLETSVNSLVSEQGVVAGKMTVGGDFTAATVQGGGNLALEGVTLKGGELAWFADGVGKTCGNLDTLEAMPFAKGGLESANGTKKWTAEQDGFVQVLFVNGAGETKVSLKVGDIWITPEAGYAVRNTNGSEARRLLWTVPVSKDQGVEFGANGGQCRYQFIPFGK